MGKEKEQKAQEFMQLNLKFPGQRKRKDNIRHITKTCMEHRNTHAIYRFFLGCKIENFQYKIVDIFLIFAQNIDCGHTLEPPRRGGSNEYPQSIF